MVPSLAWSTAYPLLAVPEAGLIVVLFFLFLLVVLIVFGLYIQDHLNRERGGVSGRRSLVASKSRTTENLSCTHLQRLFVHGHLGLETREIEIILYKFLRNLGEVLMSEKSTKAGDPRLWYARVCRHDEGRDGRVAGC
jgi:hypothetical protein